MVFEGNLNAPEGVSAVFLFSSGVLFGKKEYKYNE